MEIEIVI